MARVIQAPVNLRLDNIIKEKTLKTITGYWRNNFDTAHFPSTLTPIVILLRSISIRL